MADHNFAPNTGLTSLINTTIYPPARRIRESGSLDGPATIRSIIENPLPDRALLGTSKQGGFRPVAFIFLSYFVTFVCVIRGLRIAGFACLALSTALSIGIFFHHTTSSLDLNF